jgi:NAD(P)-dependent dehydrogenase (short-subunit alcohol dehydrogenase family)
MKDALLLASRTFSEKEQNWFAQISGDYNPMHMDTMVARRTQAGATVVHGIHVLLWALDAIARHNNILEQAHSIKAQFFKWVHLDSEVSVFLTASTGRQTRLQVRIGITEVMSIVIGLEESSSIPRLNPSTLDTPRIPPLTFPNELTLDELGSLMGSVDTSSVGYESCFPALVQSLQSERVAAITSLSYIVGMQCPGLHSIFSTVDLRFTNNSSSELNYRVVKTLKPYRLVYLFVEGPGVEGTIQAFVRHAPARQLTLKQIATRVETGEFSGVRALVIGGSRGLGELTAKIIAAGGGEVTISYSLAKDQALQVAAEIRACGFICSVIHYDASQPSSLQVNSHWRPTQLYYFATPQIFRVREQVFSRKDFQEFNNFYVNGFYDLCKEVSSDEQELTVFYPSSIAVGEHTPNMLEYAMAKAAGECLCADMNRDMPGVRVVCRRLPRIATDQTLSVLPTTFADALDTLLPIIREMRDVQRSSVQIPHN